jgi:hypothetical protein
MSSIDLQTMMETPLSAKLPPEAKIRMIKSSWRCLVASLIGMIPVIGLPFALGAVLRSRRLEQSAAEGNPARRYVTAARRFGLFGFFISIVFLVLGCFLFAAFESGLTPGPSGSS